jgi:hypothetical protein
MRELRILVPEGMLGFQYPIESLQKGLALNPDMIGVDAGSTDAGPHKLGAGVASVSRRATKRDLAHILQAGYERHIPVIVGSAGGAGAEPHVNWTLDIVKEIQEEKGMNLRTVVIHAELGRSLVKRKIKEGKIRPLGPESPLDERTVDETVRIVGMMGIEPIIEALARGPDLIIAGRCCDAAIFASFAVRNGFPKGLAWHMGQIIECGALCSEGEYGASDCIMAIVRDDHFLVGPPREEVKCTPRSVAAHGFYEEPHPSRLRVPGGTVVTSNCRFEQVDGRWVRVTGSEWDAAERYEVLLEGSAKAGYRTLVVAGIRDPILIAHVDEVMTAVREMTDGQFEREKASFRLDFIVYGRDGVMGALEPTPVITSHEICIILDVIGETQELADAVCAYARSFMQHYHYEGIKATAANLAFPTAPSDIPVGPVYKFTVHHLMEVADPLEHFPIELKQGL